MSGMQLQAFAKPLLPAPDAEDIALHQRNCAPELLTRRLRELVPLLEFVDCKVEKACSERTVLTLPLLVNAMNQNGTHQAAALYLLADYTLGVAIFAVLPGTYVTGIHDRCNALPMQYWLKRGQVEHLAPGTGMLRAEVRITAEQAATMRRQLVERGRCELAATVTMTQDGELVAEARHTIGIYADMPRVAGMRANLFQVQNLKTSALMIAGLRSDEISQQVAGEQGRAIARRMAVATPQLPALVRARGLHLERVLARKDQHAFAQVLVIGLGLDPKPLHHAGTQQRWFGLDLRDMLREREQRFAALPTCTAPSSAHVTAVVGDIRLDNWDRALLQAGFDPAAPTLIITEGMSMYFTREELAQLFVKLRQLGSSEHTRLWLDYVTARMFELEAIEARAFLSSMNRLGEPFILGFEDASTIAPDAWAAESSTSAARVLGVEDAVCAEYHFAVLNPLRASSPADAPCPRPA